MLDFEVGDAVEEVDKLARENVVGSVCVGSGLKYNVGGIGSIVEGRFAVASDEAVEGAEGDWEAVIMDFEGKDEKREKEHPLVDLTHC